MYTIVSRTEAHTAIYIAPSKDISQKNVYFFIAVNFHYAFVLSSEFVFEIVRFDNIIFGLMQISTIPIHKKGVLFTG